MLRVSRHLWGISAPNIMDFRIQSLIWVFPSDQRVEVFSWQVRSDCIWPPKCKVKGQRSLGFSVSESDQSRQEVYLNFNNHFKAVKSRPRSTWRLLESNKTPQTSVGQLQLVQNAGPDLANIRGLEPDPPSHGQILLLVYQALTALGPNWSFWVCCTVWCIQTPQVKSSTVSSVILSHFCAFVKHYEVCCSWMLL